MSEYARYLLKSQIPYIENELEMLKLRKTRLETESKECDDDIELALKKLESLKQGLNILDSGESIEQVKKKKQKRD